MKTVGLLVLIILLDGSVMPAAAQEYFYENGAYVALGAQASFISRDKKINYGFARFCDPTPVCIPLAPPLNATGIRDVAPSPKLTIGYKFNDDNIMSLSGDWAHYSVNRSVGTTDANGFTAISVDGQEHVSLPPGNGPVDVGLDWNSDVYNIALEYQRRLTSGDLGGVLGLLGFKLRHESQEFKARAFGAARVLDSYRESLDEFLFGPYAGLKISFKPRADSNFNFNMKGAAGWYFKNAFFEGRNRYFNGEHFSQDDHSKQGTVFVTAGLDIAYALTKNWHLDASYEFNWINQAAHIFNPDVSKHGIPSKIVGSGVFTHAPGLKLTYKF